MCRYEYAAVSTCAPNTKYLALHRARSANNMVSRSSTKLQTYFYIASVTHYLLGGLMVFILKAGVSERS